MTRSHFNSQPHKEADILWFWIPADTHYFNSQPHKEADIIEIIIIEQAFHFNSQPHKEADSIWKENSISAVEISTHSLTRRLTFFW